MKTIIASLTTITLAIGTCFAQLGPGWHNNIVLPDAPPIPSIGVQSTAVAPVQKGVASSPKSGKTISKDAQPELGQGGGLFSLLDSPVGNDADYITPEIQDLADGLRNDPVAIYEYVKNNIDYDHYFGVSKGAHLTLMEGSGNDMDQCVLLVSLLRASGYEASYKLGLMEIPYEAGNGRDLKHWIGFTLANTNAGATFTNVASLLYSRGAPYYVSFDTTNYFRTFTNNISFHRMWVELVAGGSNTYVLDPSFKTYTNITGIDISAIAGFSKAAMVEAAAAGVYPFGGQYIYPNFYAGQRYTQIAAEMTRLCTNLLNYLNTNQIHPNSSVRQIVGGRQLNREIVTNLPTTLEFNQPTTLAYSNTVTHELSLMGVTNLAWSAIPESLMASLRVKFNSTSGTSTNTLTVPFLRARRLGLSFETPHELSLWLDDEIITTQTVLTNTGDLEVEIGINHCFGKLGLTNTGLWWIEDDGVFTNTLRGDQISSKPFARTQTNGTARSVIMCAFRASDRLLLERQKRLDQYYRDGMTATNRETIMESLNIMGLNWLYQTELVQQCIGDQAGWLSAWIHRVGRVAQEGGFFIDAHSQLTSTFKTPDQDWSDFSTRYVCAAYFQSALEHGVIEQMQPGISGASTVKMIKQSLENGNCVYLAYDQASLDKCYTEIYGGMYPHPLYYIWGMIPSEAALVKKQTLSSYIASGAVVLFPNNVDMPLDDWSGFVMAASWTNSATMLIEGGYHGGYASSFGNINPTPILKKSSSEPLSISSAPFSIGFPSSFDPVSLLDGSLWHENTDLTVGGEQPRGLSIGRHYSSNRRYQNIANIGYGWTHSSHIYVTEQSGARSGLGKSTPQHMAPFLAAMAASIGTYSNSVWAWAGERATTAMIADWAIEQLKTNAVNLVFGKESMEFIRMPDGSFIGPAGSTATLTNVSGSYKMQLRHGDTFIFASTTNATKSISSISNWYGQSMTFGYDSDERLTNMTDTFNRKLTFAYNNSNLVSSVSDDYGRQVTYLYDTNNYLTNYTDPEGKQHTYIYDADGKLTSLLDPFNRVLVTNIYNNSSQVVEQWNEGKTNKVWKFFFSGYCNIEEDPLGGCKTYLYDERSRLISMRDANGFLTQTVYDGQDHVIRNVGPSGETNGMVYDFNHNLRFAYDTLGFTNSFGYDSQHHLVAVTNARGFVTTLGYNPQHDVVVVTNAGVTTNWFNYYASGSSQAGLLQNLTNADGFITTNKYDNYGNPLNVAYPGGLATEGFLYSARGDLLQHTNALGQVTTNGYNARREVTNTVVVGFATNSIAYDDAGNAVRLVDGLGNVISNAYSTGKLLLTNFLPVLAAGSPTIRHLYDTRDWNYAVIDSLGHTSETVYDAGQRVLAASDPLSRSVGFAYDSSGRTIAVTNPLGQVTRTTYNLRGEALAITNALNHRLAFAYDAIGNRTTVTNRRDKVFTITFDKLGRAATNRTPLGFENIVTFNGRGLVTTNIEPSGQRTTNTYDALGRLTTRADATGMTTNRYDALGNVTNIVEGGKTNRYAYDNLGRLTNFVDSANRPVAYTYDANNNLKTLYYAGYGSAPVTYSYDSHNRLTNTMDWTGKQTRFEYDLAGRLTKITRPNGTVRETGYDAAGQLTNILERTASGTPIVSYKFSYDSAGRLTGEYRAPLPTSWSSGNYTQTFDDDNRVASVNGTTFTNDADGNLTWALLNNWYESIHTNALYDSRNRLQRFGAYTNVYDPAGYRISARSHGQTNDFHVVPLGGTTHVLGLYPNWGGNATYIYGQGLLYMLDGGGNGYYYHYDQRGSTVAITDDSGNIVYRAAYSPYGQVTTFSGSFYPLFGFNGRYGVMIDNSGLLYMRARYYNPIVGRFMNADPIGFEGGWNVYAFAEGDPIALADPSGLDPTVPKGYYEHITEESFQRVEREAWAFGVRDGIDAYQSGRYFTHDYGSSSTREAGYHFGANGAAAVDAAITIASITQVGGVGAVGRIASGAARGIRGGIGAEAVLTRNALLGQATAHNLESVPKAIVPLGRWGETKLELMLGRVGRKPPGAYQTSMGTRFLDRLVNEIAHEAKAGKNVRLTTRIRNQILKDKELIDSSQIRDSHWHFFNGVDPEVIKFLQKNGIKHTIY